MGSHFFSFFARRGLACVLGLTFLGSCVKQSDYDMLLQEKQKVEADLAQANAQLQQNQATLQSVQARMLQLINIQTSLQKREEELNATRQELETLKAQFEKFRTQRRAELLHKHFPVLVVNSSTRLTNARITSLDNDQVVVQHDGGILKLPLADAGEILQWESCYDPNEKQMSARERFLAEARLTEERMNAASKTSALQTADVNAAKRNSKAVAAAQIKAEISAQRMQLNREYEILRSRNSSAFKNVQWDSAQPEASSLFTTMSSRPAVLGIGRLDSLRSSIQSNLMALQQVGGF